MIDLCQEPRLRQMEWGEATRHSLADDGRPRILSNDRRWTDDVRAVAGVTPTFRRLSLGWSSLQPDGAHHWAKDALGRADRTLDELRARGLRVCLSLSRLDLPAWLDQLGGWLTRDSALYFAEYAAEAGRRFGDRVDRWTTVSDLAVCTVAGRPADMPGGHCDPAGLAAVHHALLAHGMARNALRASGVEAAVGLTTPVVVGYPATDDPWDRIAAENLQFWGNRLVLDPLLRGDHLVSDDGRCPVEQTGCVRPGDPEIIGAPQDFLGISWEAPHLVAAVENVGRLPQSPILAGLNRMLVPFGFGIVPFPDNETTARGWPIMPEALADCLAVLHDSYGDLLPPLYIVDRDAHDTGHPRRLLAAKLSWLCHMIERVGLDVRGYEHWPVSKDVSAEQRYARLCPDDHADRDAAPDGLFAMPSTGRVPYPSRVLPPSNITVAPVR